MTDKVESRLRSLAQQVRVTLNESAAESMMQGHLVSSRDCSETIRPSLEALRFSAKADETLIISGEPPAVVVGIGDGVRTVNDLRRAAAKLVTAAPGIEELSVHIPASDLSLTESVQSVIEGALLGRYDSGLLKRESRVHPLRWLNLVVSEPNDEPLQRAVDLALALARSTNLARDLANLPPSLLTASRLADVASSIGAQFGLGVEVFDEADLEKLGCGGVLGVNAGSIEPPRLIRLTYEPQQPGTVTSHLALVGKGITYDSGGISLKTDDPMHQHMKMDMSGAASVLAAMTALKELHCRHRVTGWMVCTDNMISASATKLGDVLTAHNGMTIEVTNTDCEGRLILADALSLAVDDPQTPDAVVNIATLTESSLAALGDQMAAAYTTSPSLFAQLDRAGEQAGEYLWQLPVNPRYRPYLDSEVADIKNFSSEHPRGILAALFLQEFVRSTPWCHIDMVSTMRSNGENPVNPIGATGFGARLLAEFALNFRPVT